MRIIAGEWRGRKLPVADVDALRPTPDRVRETLFNWLQPVIEGARCLDLFAGTGVLGLEALSRGANTVVMVEQEPELVDQLQDNIRALRTENVKLVQADALQWLQSNRQVFDIVFLDPPFKQDQIPRACITLKETRAITPASRLYIESEPELVLPEGFQVIKQGKAGKVQFILAAMV